MHPARPLSALGAGLLAIGLVALLPATSQADPSNYQVTAIASTGSLYGGMGIASGPNGVAYAAVIDNTNPLHVQMKAISPNGQSTDLPWGFTNQLVGHLEVDAAGDIFALVVNENSPQTTEVMELKAGATQPQVLPFPDIRWDSCYCTPGLAVSPAGDVYVNSFGLESNQNSGFGIYELPAGGSEATLLPASGFNGAALGAVAVDQSGNLYVEDITNYPHSGAFVIKEFTPGSSIGTTVVEADPTTGMLDPNCSYADDLLVKGDQLLALCQAYVANSSQQTLVEIPKTGGPFDVLASWSTNGNPSIGDIASDSQGNVFVSALSLTSFYKVQPKSSMVATDSARSVPENTSEGLELSAIDPSGGVLTYSVTAPPSHGTLTGRAPNLTYAPDAGYTGPDSVGWSVSSSSGGSASATVSITVSADGTDSVSQPVVAGQTVATDDAPTADQPTTSAVTTPVAGTVTITQDPSIADPTGYAVVGSQYRIEAPAASVAAPLELTFQIDTASLPPGQDGSSVLIFRNGTAIAPCADTSGTATPDPCVSTQTTTDGVVTITVLTSHASEWTVGVLKRDTTTTVAPVAASTYGQPMTLAATVSQPGTAAPTGSVTFTDVSTSPATVLGSTALDSTGKASLTGLSMNAGIHQVVASFAGSAFSNASSSTPQTITVTPQPVPFTVSGTQPYGVATPAFTATGTTPTGITRTGNPTCSTTTTGAPINAVLGGGTYAIDPTTCTGLGLTGTGVSNYKVTYTNGGYTVTRAHVGLTTSSTSSLMSILTGRMTYTTTVKNLDAGIPAVNVPVVINFATSTGTKTQCTATTNSSGVATCTTGPISIALGLPSYPYTASTPGNGNYLPGTTNGTIPIT